MRMLKTDRHDFVYRAHTSKDERGAALVTTILVLALVGIVSISILAVVSKEANIAGSDLQRTKTFYAASAGIEKMTSDFSALFERKSKPNATDLTTIQNNYPSELVGEGFTFNQTIFEDTDRLAEMRASTGTGANSYPTVPIPSGPFSGLIASVSPYRLRTTATQTATHTEVTVEREMNNYLIPLFQFGMFSDTDLEVHPGAPFFFNGRVHANGNLYATGVAKFLDRVTVGNEFVRTILRNGNNFQDGGDVRMQVGSVEVQITQGSVNGGPNLSGATAGQRGYFPDAPNGTNNSTWKSNSILAAVTGTPNQMGGQLLTRSTGAVPLFLPLQLGGNPTREIIKRRTSTDDQILNDSRYHSKAQIRILLDDEDVYEANNVAAIPDGKGVELSETSTSSPYYFEPQKLGGGKALARNPASGSPGPIPKQGSTSAAVGSADCVRGVRTTTVDSPTSCTGKIPGGSGIKGRILIEIVPPNGGAPIDVTRTILSMGMTEGEPNGIVYLQRPFWAAFVQGSRDRSGGTNTNLVDIINNTSFVVDGQIGTPTMNSLGYLSAIPDAGTGYRKDSPDTTGWNRIVPINMYNVREGWIRGTLTSTTLYERGMTSVVELNMRNLTRWVDGYFDANLLQGTSAVSSKVDGTDGYIVYVSDRRGDRPRSEYPSYDPVTGNPDAAAVVTTNGIVDNEDVYGSDGIWQAGEDVIDYGKDPVSGALKKGTLQVDTNECPSPSALPTPSATPTLPTGVDATRWRWANAAQTWNNPNDYFKRAVRLFNGEDLQSTTTAGKLSLTKGITVASENMVYIWGNYNTTGISSKPANGSTLADGYTGDQVPASIVSDAFFPLSKTWFDASSSMYPEACSNRRADAGITSITQGTAVRAGIIAGNTLSSLAGTPDVGNGNESRLSGGIHNFPRFSEDWGNVNWNFIGALAPLYRSTQALAPYNANGVIYGAPVRNWAFDDSFKDPSRLPPGTPTFQYIEPTGFRQVIN